MNKATNTELRRVFAERLKESLYARYSTTRAFALTIEGVTPNAVRLWTSGASMPKPDMWPGICHLLGVSADWLLGIEDECQ